MQRSINFLDDSTLTPHLSNSNGWDDTGLPSDALEFLEQRGIELGDVQKIKVSYVHPANAHAAIGYVFRIHNKKGPQILPWRGLLRVITDLDTEKMKWVVLGPFELDAKKIKEGATRSASNESEHKAMWAVFEAWRDYQGPRLDGARKY